MSFRRGKRLLILAVLATPFCAASAQAVESETEQVPSVWRTGQAHTVGYDVRLTAGAEAEEVAVVYDLPEFTLRDGREPVGSALEDLRPRVSPPGVHFGVLPPAGVPGYSEDTCFRGGMQRFSRVDLFLPAHSVTTVRLRFRLRAAPYRAADLAVPIDLLHLRDGDVLSRLRLRSGPPRLTGRLGLPIRRLALSSGDPPSGAIRRGATLRVRGRVTPRLAGRRIFLRHFASKPSFYQLLAPLPFRTLAKPLIDRQGRFQYQWRPQRLGWHELRAVFPGSRVFVRDEGCPSRFFVSR